MTRQATLKAALQLSPDERITLAMDLWEAIAADAERLPVSEAQKRELDRRLAALDADPSATVAWETVRKELRDKL